MSLVYVKQYNQQRIGIANAELDALRWDPFHNEHLHLASLGFKRLCRC